MQSYYFKQVNFRYRDNYLIRRRSSCFSFKDSQAMNDYVYRVDKRKIFSKFNEAGIKPHYTVRLVHSLTRYFLRRRAALLGELLHSKDIPTTFH